jgi:tRNA nucleotidyltransferase/poly(A) polymerase
MKLRELLAKMKEVQQKIGSSEPFICGGTPRDRYLGHIENIADLDITTGDKTVDYLSQEFEIELRKQYKVSRTTASDGHSTIHLGKFKMDFSSNFNAPDIDQWLAKNGIQKPTAMQKEIFSRDFTCNALLLSLDLKQLTDPTHRGFKDIKDKMIRTCLSPEVTLTTNKNRVIRAIYLASKLDFEIDPTIIEYVQKNPQTVKIATTKVLTEKLNDAFQKNPDRATYYINKMHLWDQIPITEVVQPYYMKTVNMPQKKAYFQGGGGVNEPTPGHPKYKADKAIVVQPRFEEPFYHNYDLYNTEGVDGPAKLGPGAGWNHMNEYKSIKEYLEHQRQRLNGKYVAKDSWITEDNYKERENKMKIRAELLNDLIKIGGRKKKKKDTNELDFAFDNIEGDMDSGPIIGDSESFEKPIALGPDGPADTTISPGQVNLGDYESYPASVQIGGMLDKYLPQDDFEGKSPSSLDFGRDYTDEEDDDVILDSKTEKQFEKFINKYLKNKTDSYGLPDGVEDIDEDLGGPANLNPDYGTYGPESLMYEDKWNI